MSQNNSSGAKKWGHENNKMKKERSDHLCFSREASIIKAQVNAPQAPNPAAIYIVTIIIDNTAIIAFPVVIS